MLAFKLALVAASVLLSTLAARRFGHAVGGAVAGMPMIAAPIIGILLIDQHPAQVRAIALATLACLPAAIVHIVSFAHTARHLSWPLCLLVALAVFLACGLLLTRIGLPPGWVCVLAAVVPGLGLLAAPRVPRVSGPVPVPRVELVLRVAAAVAMAAAVILGADALPAAVSGLLLAVPITGSVLPCFTLPRYGAQATASLMGGFMQGLHGFAAFFITLYVALGRMSPWPSFVLALLVSLLAAVCVQGARSRLARRLATPVEP